MDALAATVAPGSGSVIFTPWLNGERTPIDDRSLRASWVNQSLTTTRADLVRAVLEGVAYNTKWLLGAVEKFVERRLDPLRVVGGGATSDLWCRIHADVLERTIEQVDDPRAANVRGAGFLGLVGLGRATYPELARSVRVAAVHRPDPATAATYRPLAREFKRLYRRTRAIHSRLNG
jgi:xylulokinase